MSTEGPGSRTNRMGNVSVYVGHTIRLPPFIRFPLRRHCAGMAPKRAGDLLHTTKRSAQGVGRRRIYGSRWDDSAALRRTQGADSTVLTHNKPAREYDVTANGQSFLLIHAEPEHCVDYKTQRGQDWFRSPTSGARNSTTCCYIHRKTTQMKCKRGNRFFGCALARTSQRSCASGF